MVESLKSDLETTTVKNSTKGLSSLQQMVMLKVKDSASKKEPYSKANLAHH